MAQQLLLRCLVARFWETPYTAKLVDWDTSLHDRFMLPQFVRQDFNDVVDEIRASGLRDGQGVVRSPLRVPLPADGRILSGRHADRTPQGDRTVVRPRRRVDRHGDLALRRFLAGATAGDGRRDDQHAALR